MASEDISTFRIALETLEEQGKIRVQIKEGAADGYGASDPEYPVSPFYVTCRNEVELDVSCRNEVELGRILYDTVFVGAIRERFEAFRSTLGRVNPEGPVRLRLLLEIQASPKRRDPLLNLPWELLHDGQGFLALDHGISIARCSLGVQPVERSIHPPLRVLVAFATPQTEKLKLVKPSDGEAHFQSITESLREIEPLDLRPLPHATKRSLREALTQGIHVFHFLGHGDVEIQPGVDVVGRLYLENPDTPDLADVLTSTTLRDWFNQSLLRPNLVIITACHSARIDDAPPDMGVAQSLLYAGIPAVIGMQTVIYVDEAHQFASSFYRMLAERAIVDEAVLAARRALARNSSVLRSRLRSRGTESVLQRILDLESNCICFIPSSSSLSHQEPMKNAIPFPAWAVPVLFLQGSGWLGQAPPKHEIKWQKDGKTMVYVEEGRFYVDKHPVTCEEYKKFVDETGRIWHNPWENMEDWKHIPATNITLEDALAYARWAGKHLPTLEQWQQAALAGCPDKSCQYPWGHEFRAGRCNSREMGLNRPWSIEEAEKKGCSNNAGVFDLVGNVAEWAVRKEDNGSQQGMVCGGSFREPKEHCTVQSRRIVDPDYKSEAVGFRCIATWADIVAQEAT